MPDLPIEPSQVYDLADALGGLTIFSIGVGPDGDAIFLTVDPESEDIAQGRDTTTGASFPHSLAKRSYPATVIHTIDQDIVVRTEIPEMTAAYPHIQPLGNGRILIVAARCRYNDGHPEENATIYSADGNIERRMVFGDGIADVQVSRKQQIWVSYFDEGIFGNRGWNKPVGAYGLLCFDTAGQITWRFEPPIGFDIICDCYAMNVARNAVWACYYTGFPVVKITDGSPVQGWANEVYGARALATDGARILLYGGYGEERNRCVLQTIAADRLRSPVRLNLVLPATDTPQPMDVIGRGPICTCSGERCGINSMCATSRGDAQRTR